MIEREAEDNVLLSKGIRRVGVLYICAGCNFTESSLDIMKMHVASNHFQLSQGNPQTTAKRNPTNVRYDILMPEFLQAMAQIAQYGASHYGDFNWTKSRLTGDKSPINHIYEHLQQYRMSEYYDHPEVGISRSLHLAAIAFNAMMEFWYELNCDKEVDPNDRNQA